MPSWSSSWTQSPAYRITSSMLDAVGIPLYCTNVQDQLDIASVGAAGVAAAMAVHVQTFVHGSGTIGTTLTKNAMPASGRHPRSLVQRSPPLWCREGHFRRDSRTFHKTPICWPLVRIGAYPPQWNLYGAYCQCQHHAKPYRPAQGRLA